MLLVRCRAHDMVKLVEVFAVMDTMIHSTGVTSWMFCGGMMILPFRSILYRRGSQSGRRERRLGVLAIGLVSKVDESHTSAKRVDGMSKGVAGFLFIF